jgi:hypothetical protein
VALYYQNALLMCSGYQNVLLMCSVYQHVYKIDPGLNSRNKHLTIPFSRPYTADGPKVHKIFILE